MKIFLTSDLLNYKKVNNKHIPTKINNDNGIVDQLKENLKDNRGIVFFASSKSEYSKTDNYANILFESLKLSGISFYNYYIIDDRFKGSIKNIIDKCDMVFIAGGDTLEEMKFFNDIELKDLLKGYNGVIMGISAGAINLAYDVYNSPESKGDLEKESKWNGLCLTYINIEPHFVYSDENFTPNEKLQREEVLKESYNRVLYGLLDGSHITDIDGRVNFYGTCYKISNGKITLICKNKKRSI